MALVQFASEDVTVSVPRVPKKMITISEENGKTKVEINSSSLSVIQECLRKAQYSLHERWKSDVESPATVFGSAIHKALEVFYSAPVEAREMVSLEELEMTAIHGVKKKGLLYDAVGAFAKTAELLRPLPDTDKRSLLNGAWILHNYFKTYLNDPYIAYVDDQGPFIERTFSHRFHESDNLIIDIFGTIDFAFQHVTNGNIIVGDHKSASSLGFGSSSYFDRDKPNHQYTMYMMGARRVFGLDTEDFMVNVVEVKARPKTARGSGPSFPRQVTRRNEEDFEELHDVVLKTVRDYLAAIESGKFPLGPVLACNSYGSCQYKQVCASPKSLRQNILTSKFTQEI